MSLPINEQCLLFSWSARLWDDVCKNRAHTHKHAQTKAVSSTVSAFELGFSRISLKRFHIISPRWVVNYNPAKVKNRDFGEDYSIFVFSQLTLASPGTLGAPSALVKLRCSITSWQKEVGVLCSLWGSLCLIKAILLKRHLLIFAPEMTQSYCQEDRKSVV